MLTKILNFVKGTLSWVKAHAHTILLVLVVMLFVLFSFACGYIIAEYQDREPVKIEQK